MQLQKLKTFSDACKVLHVDPKKVVPDFKAFLPKDRKAMQAHAKLVIIARAANRIANNGKDWKPNWDSGNYDKYYPWFWMEGGSSGFRYSDCGLQRSNSLVGSRLCYISSEVAEYVGKTFLSLYKQYFVM